MPLSCKVDPYILRYGSESEVREAMSLSASSVPPRPEAQAVRKSIDAVGGPGRLEM